MIHYLRGDATRPAVPGPKIIAHGCNNVGAWGAGFVLAVSRRWEEPEGAYHDWFEESTPSIGEVQFVGVEPELWVANMITQTLGGPKPLSYAGLEACLQAVAKFAKTNSASVHMPRVGCGLAGGTWDRVGPLVEDVLKDIEVYVYDFP